MTFTIHYGATGPERKRLVEAMAEHLGCSSHYAGAPTFAYEVDYFTVSKDGAVSFDDRADSEEIEALCEFLTERGFTAEDAPARELEKEPEEPQEENADRTGESEAQTEEPEEPNTYNLTVAVPAESFTEISLGNLRSILAAKGTLIRKALGITDIPIEVTDTRVAFPWFAGALAPEETKAYSHFIAALCDMAINQKRVTLKEKEVDNEKYAFRCFLLRLGFIGAEFKEERKILLRNLSGSTAFKAAKKGDAE